jgi:single-stranded-DNA-specific exonuclease
MSIGIHCLLTDDQAQAKQLAGTLDQLNRERRSIESEMQDQALAHLETLTLDDDAALPTGLCLFQPDWHQGVIGILASRIKERYHRPVIAFAEADADTLKGSARSVPGFHIRDALDAVATRYPGLIQKFGGHAMAAGLSLAKNRFEEFVVAFDEEARRHLTPDDLQGTLWSDGELAAADFTLELAEALRHSGPWGQGFPEPLFDGTFEIVNRRIVGERHLKLVLRLPGQAININAIAFNSDDHDWPDGVQQLCAAFKLDVNEFRGARELQLVLDYLEPV